MTPRQIAEMLEQHRLWLGGKGGSRADLRDAFLRGANLRDANLRGAFLRGADLRGANLSGATLISANLRDAYLRGADLSGAHLGGANLSGATLSGADLRDANLGGAHLRNADLSGARVSAGTQWPSPTMVLLCQWGEVSDDLTADLMRFDAASHPEPQRFDAWAKGGACPYDGVQWERAAYFSESVDLWPGLRKRPRPPIELAQRLIAECCEVTE